MREQRFTDRLVKLLKRHINNLEVATKIPVLYSIFFNHEGMLQLHIDSKGAPKRGMGMGFEQDLVIYKSLRNKDTSIVPLVIAEVKFEKMGSHSAIIYSEKARRIRTIYPYVRYGLILGGMDSIPPRVLRLGPEFDFIMTLPKRISQKRLSALVRKLKSEFRLAQKLSAIYSGKKIIKEFHRKVRISLR